MPVPTFKPINNDTQEINDKFKEIYDYLNTLTAPAAVTKASLGLDKVDNTSDLNKPISAPVQTALNLKADKGTTTGGGLSSIITTDDNFLEIRPLNYGGTIGSFTMGIKKFDGVNSGDPRPNIVGSFWGYNTTPGGGQKIPGEFSYRFAGETYFDGGDGVKLSEIHMPDFFTNSGLNVRTNSTYFNRATGQAFTNMQLIGLNLKRYNNAGIDWLSFNDNNGNTIIAAKPSMPGGYVHLDLDGHSISTSSANNKLRILTKGIVEFNQPLGGLDGGAFEIQFNANGTGKTFKVVNGNGNYKAFEVTKDGINTGGATFKLDKGADGKPILIMDGVTYKLVVQ